MERPRIPVVQYAVSRYGGEPMGGIQGLWWYARSLFVDPDGDVTIFFTASRFWTVASRATNGGASTVTFPLWSL